MWVGWTLILAHVLLQRHKKVWERTLFSLLLARNTLLWREVYIRQIFSIFGAQTPFQNTNHWLLVIFYPQQVAFTKRSKAQEKTHSRIFFFVRSGRMAHMGIPFSSPSLSPPFFGTQTLLLPVMLSEVHSPMPSYLVPLTIFHSQQLQFVWRAFFSEKEDYFRIFGAGITQKKPVNHLSD